ncbi:palmitoyltransferase ZDHHC1 isoform X3 [Gambusia affinis]|uniref:palmitoyltransferase ZDHHC1 isoform X3 n=1 Tax=Gambusia affinis TaxID=33528 RepID=UPI001CDCF0D6|nr:palmitoyltransferase ZDHHC1 isoform X3 [Gambusia affinis]
MEVCGRNPNRTAPTPDPRRSEVPLCSRTNGWTWPPHPFQLLAWLLYVYFAVTGFGVFVPLLPPHWVPAGYICTGILFVSHLCVHVLAVSIDPADLNVRMRNDRGPVPAFDRSKHAHVIENCHCYLCQVDVLFLHSVVSALLGVSLVLVFASYVFVEFFRDPSNLRTDKHFLVQNQTGVWFVFLPVAPLRSAAAVIPVLAAVTMAMGLLSSGLLCHLLCFHIYLMWNRLSTYEYIVRQRHRLDSRDLKTAAAKQSRRPSVVQDVNYSGTLGYTNPQLDVQQEQAGTCAGSDPVPSFLANGRGRVHDEEAPPTASTELKAHTHRHTQKKKKKKKKGCQVPAEVTREHCPPVAPPPAESSQGQWLPFPAFPLRAPPGQAPAPGPIQAAAPPAEYHSDSAESLEEIPVALAKLGSSSSRDAAGASCRPDSRLTQGTRSPLPDLPTPALHKTRKKNPSSRGNRTTAQLRFEMASTQPPSVFVSRASGEMAEVLGWMQIGSRPVLES